MSGIQNDSLDLANVWNAVRAHQRLNGFGHISARHQKFSVLLK